MNNKFDAWVFLLIRDIYLMQHPLVCLQNFIKIMCNGTIQYIVTIDWHNLEFLNIDEGRSDVTSEFRIDREFSPVLTRVYTKMPQKIKSYDVLRSTIEENENG